MFSTIYKIAICPRCNKEKNGWMFREVNGVMVCEDCAFGRSDDATKQDKSCGIKR